MKTTQDTRQATQDTTPTHTPGPWNADKNFMGPDTYGDGNSIPVFPRGGGVAICDVVAVTGEGLSRPDVQARAEANARLIAAAPELLAALMDYTRFQDYESRPFTLAAIHERALSALAKATGGTL
jgi:hypothetical protein